MNDEKLPRLLKDPETGEIVLEFLQYEGHHKNCIDRRVIVGAMKSDMIEDDHVCANDVGILRLANGLFPTAHDYEVLRDLLWPQEKEGFF